MTWHDILAAVLFVAGILIGVRVGIRIERKRWISSVPSTFFTPPLHPHWQKQKPKEPIPEHDL